MIRYVNAAMLAMFVVVVPVLPACKTTQLSPQAQQMVADLDEEAAVARAEGDEEKAVALEAAANQVIIDETQANATLFKTALALIPGVGPLLSQVPEELYLLGAPLLFKRPRKHLAKAAKDATDGVLKAAGLKHTSAATEKIADEEETKA